MSDFRHLIKVVEDLDYPAPIGPAVQPNAYPSMDTGSFDDDNEFDGVDTDADSRVVFRKALLDALSDCDVNDVLIREEEGHYFYDVLLTNEKTITFSLTKEPPKEGEDDVWMLVGITPNEVFKHPLKDSDVVGEGVALDPDSIPQDFVLDLVHKWEDPGDQFEAYSLRDGKIRVGFYSKSEVLSGMKKWRKA